MDLGLYGTGDRGCYIFGKCQEKIYKKINTNKTFSLWDPSKEAPFYPRGPTLLLLTVVLLWVLRFSPTIHLLGGGMPPMTWQ